MKRLLRNMTYANIVATLALFVAVSTGGAYARGMIDGRTIKPNSIPASALQNNSVTSAKIKNKQLTALDVKNGSLPVTVFSQDTQRQLASIGGDSSQGGTRCPDGSDLSTCSTVDVVPTGVGQPCRFLEGGYLGVWQDFGGGMFVCRYEKDGIIKTVAPAKAGQYSGAVNA